MVGAGGTWFPGVVRQPYCHLPVFLFLYHLFLHLSHHDRARGHGLSEKARFPHQSSPA